MTRTFRLLALIVAVSYLGCKENSSSASSNEASQTETAEEAALLSKPEIIYIANVDKLTLRDVPDKKGGVIGKLVYGQEAVYLNEESDFKEKIELRGKVRYDSWKKVQIDPGNGDKAVEGWAYGGGLSLKSEMFEEVSPNQYRRKINSVSKEELSNVLGIQIDDKYYFNGEVGYQKSNGEFVKHGKFKVVGVEIYDMGQGYEYELSSVITGNYNNGIPDGVFERKFVGYENSNVSTVYYEDGKCQWSSVMGSGEGEDYNHREENPNDCSFEYIFEALVKANAWR